MNNNYLDMAFSEIGPQLEAAKSKAELVEQLTEYLNSCVDDLIDRLEVQGIIKDIQSYAANKTLVTSDDKDYMNSLSRFYILCDSKAE